MISLTSRKDMDLTQGGIASQLIVFAIPLLLSNLFQSLYNTADTLVVGRFVGATALAAVGSTGSISGMIISFFLGMGAGAGVIISQAFGRRDAEGIQKGIHTGIAVAILMGLGFGAFGYFITPTALRWMETPEDVFDEAVLYLQINCAGLVTTTLYNITSGILRALGDSRRPFYYLVISGVTNVILNLVFVLVFHMGVAGVAVATVISQALSAGLAMLRLSRLEGDYRLCWKQIRLDWPTFRQIAKVGFPAGIQQTVISLSNVIIQSQINVFGSAAMAGQSAAGKIDAFIYMPLGAISLANSTFVAQNLGAGRIGRAKKGVWTTMLIAVAVTLLTGNLAAIFAEPLVGCFTEDAEVISYGVLSMVIRGSLYFLFVPTDVLSGTIRAGGNGVVPMVISLVNMCLLRMVWLWIAIPIWREFWVVIGCYPITWFLTSLCYGIYYLAVWKKKFREPSDREPSDREAGKGSIA